MPFVYLHTVAFAGWMLLVEASPWPTLTLVVSLEAIFLSTFVEQESELKTNTEITRAIHALTAELHHHLLVDQTAAHGTEGARP